jgi:N-acyl-D-aspartate/D-glutamate deacylase
MAHDIVIRGGTVVDGTGTPPRRADVAIDGDRVTEVGTVAGDGGRTIDAHGRLVTPGFVDIHTHLDAQIWWDPQATSSCWHGVTSVVMGNCGVTFAPCRPDDRDYLAEMMESVEDIPAEAIRTGLSWDWETYGEYLDEVDGRDLGLNVGGMVGHCAVRYHAMGERSLDPGATPTDDELNAMRASVDEAMAAGALGFSTSRTLRHTVPDGREVPGTWAGAGELLALASVMGDQGRGVFEAAPRFDGDGPSRPRLESEMAWIGEVSRGSGRPVTFNLTHTYENADHTWDALALVRRANAEGADVRPQTTSRGIGVLFTIATMTPFDGNPAWQRIKRHRTREERMAVLRDPVARDELVTEAESGMAPDLRRFFVTAGGEEGARYDCDPDQSLVRVAARRGVSPARAFVDLCLETDGRVVVYWPILNQDLDAIAEMLTDDVVVLGLADAGAHVGQILDASQPTFFLTYWIREQELLPVERAVQRLSQDGARLFGLTDRGELRPGAIADVNVIDFDGLHLPLPEFVHDFPQGAGRFVQRARGYDATLVNGQVVLEHGEHTGALPGTVLRSGPDTR